MIYVEQNVRDAFRVPQPEGRGNYIRLDQNENPDGLPQWLFESVMSKITPEFLATYPEESLPTKKYANLLNLKQENVSLTAGSTVGMGYVIKVFGQPEKKILTVTPSFAMYEVYAKMKGMSVKQLTYEPNFTFDISKILSSIDKDIGIVVLVNPNMPVGNIYKDDEIADIVNKARENNAIVIIDEAYYYFYDKSCTDLINRWDNVIVLRTFSKMLSIPALRLGAIISNPQIIKYINNYKPHYTVNSIALLFCEAIVENHERLKTELLAAYEEGKQFILKSLDENNYEYIPSHGCYICIKPKYKTARELTDRLRDNGILILCGKDGLTGWLRLTIAHLKYMQIFMKNLLRLDAE